MSKFCYKYRVRYKDVDKMGVMYYSRYFEIFEEARTELLREIALTYKRLEDRGYFLPVIKAVCEYKRSVFYDDLICVYCYVKDFTGLRVRIDYEVVRDDVTVAVGYTVHAFANDAGRPIRPPADVVEQISSYMKRGIR